MHHTLSCKNIGSFCFLFSYQQTNTGKSPLFAGSHKDYLAGLIEKDYLGDWSPEKDCCSPSQGSNHPDDLFQSRSVP